MGRLYILGFMLALIPALAYAQGEATPAAPTDYWGVLFKLAFPVVMTVVGPIVTGFIKSAPQWVKYPLSALVSVLVGAGLGEIPNLPLTPESAALMGVLSGPVGQALFMAKPQPPAVRASPPSAFWLPLILVGGLLGLSGCQTYKDTTPGRALTVEKVENLSVFGTDGGFMQLVECDKTKIKDTAFYDYEKNCDAKSAWVPISSPSKGGQILAGFLQMLGFGWLAQSNMGGSANAASNASASANAAAAVKGGHH